MKNKVETGKFKREYEKGDRKKNVVYAGKRKA